MAENKSKIVIYADWKDSFEYLTDEEAGKLIKHFFRFVNDEKPELKDRLLIASWIPIEKTLKRDLKKWNEKAGERSEKARVAGLASAEKRRQQKATKSNSVVQNELSSTKSTVSVSVSGSVNNNKGVEDDSKKCLTDTEIGKHQVFKKQIGEKEHQIWRESFYMRHKFRVGALFKILDLFITHLILIDEEKKTVADFKKHFLNWVNTQESNQKLNDHKKKRA